MNLSLLGKYSKNVAREQRELLPLILSYWLVVIVFIYEKLIQTVVMTILFN